MGVRKSIYSFILLALIAFKVCSAVIHISLHHHDDHDNDHQNHCELCEQALVTLNEEFSMAEEAPLVKEVTTKSFHQELSQYQSVSFSAFFNDTLLVRPPPAI